MAFDKKIAVELLGLFDNFPLELFLRSTEINRLEWEKLIPKSIEQYPAETILWYLYILSNSNLIFPQLKLEEIRSLLQNDSNYDSASGEFVFEILKSILQERTLTTEGYEYMNKPNV